MSVGQMFDYIIFVIVSSTTFSLAVDLHFRLQGKVIARRKTVLGLIAHYGLLVTLMSLLLLCIISCNRLTNDIDVTEVEKSLMMLVTTFFLALPILVIRAVRYPSIIDDIEAWHLNCK